MIYPEKITNHQQQMKSLLLYQFQNSPNILAFIDTYGDEIQDLENEWFDLIESLGIETARDYALDLIGKEVGEARQGKNDTDYRNAILTKIFINNSSGTPNDVILASKLITGADAVNYSEQYPAGVVLEVIGAEYVSKAPVIRTILPAAVDLVFQRNMDVDQTNTYVGVGFSYIRDIESGVLYGDFLDDNDNLYESGYLSEDSELYEA